LGDSNIKYQVSAKLRSVAFTVFTVLIQLLEWHPVTAGMSMRQCGSRPRHWTFKTKTRL